MHSNNYREKYKFIRIALCGIMASILTLIAFQFAPQYIRVEHLSANWRSALLSSRAKAASKDISIVAIDDKSISNLPYKSPIDRKYLGDLLVNISKYKPKSIVIDIVFDRRTEPQKDLELIQTLKSKISTPIVLAYSNCEKEPSDSKACDNSNFEREFLSATGRKFGYADLSEASEREAEAFVVESIPGSDGKICSLSALIADRNCHEPEKENRPIDWQLPPKIGGELFTVIRAHELPEVDNELEAILSKDDCDHRAGPEPPKLVQATAAALQAATLHCRTILVGGYFKGNDRHKIPISTFLMGGNPESGAQAPGLLVHAAAAQQLIDKRILREPNSTERAIFVFIFGIFGSIFTLNQKLNNRLFFIIFVVGVFQIFDALSYKFFQYLLPGAHISFAFLLGIMIGNFSRIFVKRKASEVLMENMEILA